MIKGHNVFVMPLSEMVSWAKPRPVSPGTRERLARQRASNAAGRGRKALRRAVGTISVERKAAAARQRQAAAARQRQAGAKKNINTLIREAGEANRQTFIRARNAVLDALSVRNKSPRVKEILKNINSRRHEIVKTINWVKSGEGLKMMSWNQVVALEQLRPNEKVFPNMPHSNVEYPLSQANNGTQWKAPPQKLGVRNVAELTRMLARQRLV